MHLQFVIIPLFYVLNAAVAQVGQSSRLANQIKWTSLPEAKSLDRLDSGQSISWIDKQRNIWVYYFYAELGEYRTSFRNSKDPRWKVVDQSPESSSHSPNVRFDAITWTDSVDNLWLYGGRSAGGNYLRNILFNH